MKEKRLYTCEICGTDYNERAKALECEKSHIMTDGVKDMRYQSHGSYPSKIEVKFKDGTTYWYKR